jgi:hypothetical protein
VKKKKEMKSIDFVREFLTFKRKCIGVKKLYDKEKANAK